jgi:PST family polysaccharide transporter
MTLTRRVTQGLALVAGGEAARQGSQFIIGILLARTLAPADYGLIGMALFVVGFLQTLGQFGGAEALIQNRDATSEDWSSVFWFGVALSFIVMATAWTSAPVAAIYFREEVVTPVVRWTAWSVVLRALGATQVAWLSKHLRFRLVALAEWCSLLLAGLIGVLMAWSGWGVWSLVAYTLVGPAATSVLLFLWCPWRPSLRFRFASLRSVARFGVSVQGQGAVNYISRRLDDALIGRYVGPAGLGQYARAYQLMLYPVQNISGVVGRIMFPALAEIGADLPRFRSAYLRAVAGIALIAFPAMLGLLVTAQEVVVVIYGSQWEPAVPILRVLCVVGLMQSVATTVGWIYMARGAAGLMLKWTMAATAVVCCAFVAGIRWGAIGVAVAYAVAMAVLLVPCLAVAFRVIELPLLSLVTSVRSALAGSLAMAAVVWCLRMVLIGEGWASLPTLAACAASGVLVYVSWLALDRPEAVRQLGAAWMNRGQRANSDGGVR